MLRRLCPVLAAGTIAVLVAAPVAFGACGKQSQCGGTSATCIYIEPHAGTPCGHGAQATPPKGLAHTFARYKGQDKALLEAIGRLGTSRMLESAGIGAAPNTLDAAFDIGFGPIALFAVLLGTAIFLVGYNGVRRRRSR